MTAPTEIQTILQNGKPAFVVIPYDDYLRMAGSQPWIPVDGIPHEVVRMTIGGQMTLARAWREYLGLTQLQVSSRMGISQPALAQMENAKRPRKSTRQKLADALGISLSQLV